MFWEESWAYASPVITVKRADSANRWYFMLIFKCHSEDNAWGNANALIRDWNALMSWIEMAATGLAEAVARSLAEDDAQGVMVAQTAAFGARPAAGAHASAAPEASAPPLSPSCRAKAQRLTAEPQVSEGSAT